MRKSFTKLFGFLLLSVMMLFSSGLYAQEAQSTVELYAGSVDACYNATNSYTSKITVRDFIKMKSFELVLKYDQTEFAFDAISNVNPLLSGGTVTATADPVAGTVTFMWTSATEVSIGDNVTGGTNLFYAKFKVLNFPNNLGDNLFDSPLTWDVPASRFFYAANWDGASYQVETTNFYNGALTVPVNYTAVTYTVTPASCASGNAVITITSPVGAGLYYYFNGSTTSSTTGIATAASPSTNTVRIVDSNGCYSHLFTIPVTAPEPLVFIGASTETPTCFGGNGKIQFSYTGGTPTYTYLVVPDANWATVDADLNGTFGLISNTTIYNNYKSTSSFVVLQPSGVYHLAIVDANADCTDLRIDSYWKTVTIAAAPSAIAFTATPANILCNGSTNGSIAVSAVSGGTASPTGSYSASINGVNWFAVSTTTPTYTFSNLAAGTYTVTVRDFNGCTTAKAATVTQPVAIAFTFTFQDVACGGTATPTGAINITGVTGGTATYTFAVAVAGTVTSTSGPSAGWVAAPGIINNLAAGYYSIWVKDANGCVKAFVNPDGSGNKLPIQIPGALAFTTSADNVAAKEVTCNGSTYTLTVTASGGTPGYKYSYNGGATSTSTTYAMGSVSTDTQVVVVVTDASGCSLTNTVTVNVPAPLTATISLLTVLSPTCPGGNDGRATISVSGGTAPYSYSSDAANFVWFTNNVIAVPEGTTTITVKDAKGCTAVTSVNVAALMASTLTATTTEIDCHGTKTGKIAVVNTWQTGRTIQYLVSASQATVYSAGTVFTPSSINGVNTTTPTTFVAGTYYIGARDEFGCTSAVISVIVKEKALLQMTAVATNATCIGLNDGTLTINTLGGLGNPTYAIVNNAVTSTNPSSGLFQTVGTWSSTTTIGKQIVQVQRGTYYVVLRDGCVSDNSVWAGPFIVDGYKAIAFDATKLVKTDITCNDANNGTITLPLASVSGGKPEFDGTGLYTFTLYKPAGGTVTNTTGAFTGLAGGSYTVTIADATNCQSAVYTKGGIVIVNPPVLSISNVKVTHFTCKNSHDGNIAITVAGGTPGYWLAINASVNLTGSDIKTSDWIAFATGATTKTYTATEAGVVYIYVKDANGCLGSTVSVTVLEPALLTPVVGTQTNVTCAGGSNGSVQINVTGGWGSTVTQTFQFKVGTATNTTGSFTGLVKGDYTAEVSATNAAYTIGNYTYPMVACKSTVAFTITEPVPYSYQGTTSGAKCKGDNGALTVTVLSGSAATTTTTGDEYYVQLTTTGHATLVNGADWKLTSGQKYTFTDLPHAIYSVWISNKNDGTGCMLPTGTETVTVGGIFKKVASWEVTEPGLALTASATWNNNVTCFGGSNGKFTVTATGGVAPYTYAAKISTWPTLQLVPDPTEFHASNVFDAATAATWVIWVKDANGCIVGGEGTISTPVLAYRVIITQPLEVAFTAAVTTTVSCYGTADGKITITTVTSAGNPFTYTVAGVDYAGNTVNITGTTTATSSFVISNIPASETVGSTTTKTYTVTLTDKNGCSKTQSLTAPVWQNKSLTVHIVKAEGAFICPGDDSGIIEAVTTGGSGNYSYRLWRDGVIYTAWVTTPSFLVEIGHTFKVEVKDPNCMATDEIILNAPVGVTATLSETTCFSDLKASVIVRATGEAGRTFLVRYRLNTVATFNAWIPFVTEKAIGDLMFSNVTPTENFYYFEVKDDKGCTINFTKSFVPVQHPVEVTIDQTDLIATATITGGISPYSYKIGSAAVVTLPADGNTFQVVNLPAGQNTITVTDAHGCFVSKAVIVAPISVTAVPASGNNQPNTFTVVLTFNRDVTGVASATTITGSTGTPTITVTGSGKVYTASIKADDLATIVLTLGNTIKDAATNTLTTTTFTYKVGDHVAPTLIVTPPASPIATLFYVGLKFSEPVSGLIFGGDAVTVSGGKLENITGIGSTYTLTVSAKEQTAVTIVITDAITDLSSNANKFAGATLTYTTGDFTAPSLVTWTPLDVTTTDNHPTFTMTFDENVILGDGGSLKVYKVSTTTPVLTIPLTTAMINGKVVTVTYAATQSGLDKDTRYYVLVDGTALQDNAGNKVDGVTDATVWTFKTGPVFLTGVDPIVNVSLEFKVYPNPFVEYVTVSNASKLSKIVVTNIAGQIVKEVVNPTDRIQLNELRSGVYFISLYSTDNVIAKTAKIVKR
jgi:hypothetical protein